MKTFTAIAAAAAISSVNAWDAEFLRGAQTGMFLTSEDQFEDYSCPAVGVKPSIQTYIDMALPAKLMMQNMNQGKPSPVMDLAFDAAVAFGKIYSVFDEDYDGGEFCQGLMFSKEASKVVFKIGNMIMNKSSEESLPEQKKLSLERKLS